MINGWPELRRSVPEDVRHYWNMRDDTSTSDGVLFAGDHSRVDETRDAIYSS